MCYEACGSWSHNTLFFSYIYNNYCYWWGLENLNYERLHFLTTTLPEESARYMRDYISWLRLYLMRALSIWETIFSDYDFTWWEHCLVGVPCLSSAGYPHCQQHLYNTGHYGDKERQLCSTCLPLILLLISQIQIFLLNNAENWHLLNYKVIWKWKIVK